MRQHSFQVAIIVQQLAGGLLTDTAYAGNIIGCIAHEPFEIWQFIRRQAVARHHLRLVVFNYLADAAFGYQHLHVFIDQL